MGPEAAAAGPSAAQVERWARASLLVLGPMLLLTAVALGAVHPLLPLAVPLGALSAGTAAWLLGRSREGVAVAVVLALMLSGLAGDLPAGKVLFGGYLVLFCAAWYARAWAGGLRLVRTPSDFGAAVLVVGGLFGGTVLGMLNRNDPMEAVLQIQAFVPVLLYFPVREVCRSAGHGPEVIGGSVLALGLGAALQNAVLTQQALSSAEHLWQIIDVRVVYGEQMLLAATLVTLGLLIGGPSRRTTWALLLCLAVLVAGLILTKSRGFWVSTLLAVGVLTAAADATQRRRLTRMSLLGVGALAVVASLVAGDYLLLIATGIVKRFTTLATAAATDASLVNRFAENAGVMRTIRANPVAGAGWGATYSYYSLLSEGTRTWGFVHNGYLGVWLKLGLWGLLAVAVTWAGAARSGLRHLRSPWLSARHRALAGASGAALVGMALAANSSSPFELADQFIVLTTLWGLAEGLAQRAAPSGGGGAEIA